MFSADQYIRRRHCLNADIGSGLILFVGNRDNPINAADNCYPFRQDSSFLYFWGLDLPDLAAVIDVDADTATVFGDDPSLDDVIWTGSQPPLAERCRRFGVFRSCPSKKLHGVIRDAFQKERPVHFLPPYRLDQATQLVELCGMHRDTLAEHASSALIRSVIRQRSIKGDAEVAEIEAALSVNRTMQTAAMGMVSPGRFEREVVGAIEGLAYGQTGKRPPFATIFTIDGQTLHNHSHANRMRAGQLVVCDCGAESSLGYASDTTRTIPVSGRFSGRQKDIYDIVLAMQADALSAMLPGVAFKDIHLMAARRLSEEFKALGLMRGDVDRCVETGAFALFFPHGLGHMLGLDVHDMESLGEDEVGYNKSVRRDERFGINRLRLAKPLEPGFVVTVEPGIYFIPPLIRQWRANNRFTDLINYGNLESYLDFGGIRIEDDVLVTAGGATVLGPAIPKSVAEVEAYCRPDAAQTPRP